MMDFLVEPLSVILFVVMLLVMFAELFNKERLIEERKGRLYPLFEAFSYSNWHQPVLPLLYGLIDELGVREVTIARENGKLQVDLKITWWAHMPWVKFKLRRKVEKLLGEGNVSRITWDQEEKDD